jgi:PAS domain-containing protein
VEEIFKRTFAGGWRGECLQRGKDGREMPLLLSTGLLRSGEGQLAGVFGIARDITERKRVEREMLLKSSLLEAQAETTIDAILAVDEGNRIILSNRHFANMFSVRLEIIQGGDDRPLFKHVLDQVADPKPFLEKVEHLYQHRAASGTRTD